MRVCTRCGEANSDQAKFCQSCGNPLPVEESGPTERRKLVTLVFCDLTGSTKLGEALDPEALRRVITRYFNEMKQVLSKHGGTVEKFIGDAVMAAFGIPMLHEDDALRAVRAAYEMQTKMKELNRDLELEHGRSLLARIGVNTGEVIAGDASAGHGFASGDAVNVAARLEQAAPPGEVLIGESTYRLVRDAVHVEEVEPLELKGKAERVPAYRLLEVLDRVEGTARRLDSPLVGREREIGDLMDTYNDAVTRKTCRLMTVFGMAGAGKSRLTAEFVRLVSDDALVVSGRCLPYGEGITFWPIAEAVKTLAGISGDESADDALTKVAALLPPDEEGALVTERIAAALGLSEATPSAQETFWAVRRLLEHLATGRPVVAIFDDIHWAEPTMLDLIEYVANFSQGAPLMVLTLSRKDLLDTRPSWGQGATTIMLEPLGETEIDALIENLLGKTQLPEQARREIKNAAEGNPLYVEEILKMLIDEGMLAKENDAWRPVKDLTNLTIPPTIQALLSARLDKLSPDEQAVMQRGSVIGKEFWWGALSTLSTEDLRARIGGYLQELVRKELILPERSTFAGEDAFRFGHIMIRDAAYAQMPKELRAELHERFAQWLEEKAGDRMLEYEEILGYHYEQSFRLREDLGHSGEEEQALGRRAAELLGNAGRRAFARSDMHAAVNLLRRTRALLPVRDPGRHDYSIELFDALMEMGDFKEAESVARQNIAVATELQDRARETRAHVQLVLLQHLTEEVEGDEEAVARGVIDKAREVNDDFSISRAHQYLAEIHWDALNTEETEKALEVALEHARKAGLKHDESKILAWLATAAFWGPRPVDEGVALCEAMLERAAGNLLVEARCLQTLAGLKAMRGEFDDARSDLARAQAMQRELGQALYLATGTQFAGYIELMADDPVAAEGHFRSGYDALEAMGDKSYLATSAALVARAVYAQDRYDEAASFTEISEKASEGDEELKAEWGPTRARVWARQGRLEDAIHLAQESLTIASKGDDVLLRGNSLMGVAEVLLLQGNVNDALEPLREAANLYASKGIAPWRDRAAALVAQLSG